MNGHPLRCGETHVLSLQILRPATDPHISTFDWTAMPSKRLVNLVADKAQRMHSIKLLGG